jgi:NAD(P)-dependent dehydrogenase (short-subunit alcohol dehydrogenase family)
MVITGGGRGIGAATARLAAAEGYRICVGFRSRREDAEDVVHSIDPSGKQAIAVQVDVADEDAVVAMFRQIDASLGRIDVLVNSAGILETQARVESIGVDRLKRVLGVNVIGSFLCAREAVRRMSKRTGGAGGSIVNVSSRAAVLGSPNEYVDYAASKAAVEALTIGLAKEVAADGIRVNAIRPGLIHTAIHASGGEPGRVDRLAPTSVPMQRGGKPEEVARAILWLASEAASYCTGAILDVSGGL